MLTDRAWQRGGEGGTGKVGQKDSHLFRSTRSIDTTLEGRTFRALVARELGRGKYGDRSRTSGGTDSAVAAQL